MVKLGNDVVEFIPFCDNIEKQFNDLKVPQELRVSLLKPFLNERARLLVNRLDAAHQDDSAYVKQYLLDQFRLVPQHFLELFNSVCRQSNDTYKSFISRLSLLLDYYLSSRKVSTFDGLKQLLISDRVKATLPEGPLNHLIKFEASLDRKYALPDEAAEVLDTYCANYDSRDRPRASALGTMAGRSAMKPGGKPAFQSAPKTTMSSAHGATDLQTKQPGQGAKAVSVPVAGKACYKCHSAEHLVKDCPLRGTVGQPALRQFGGAKGSVHQPARVSACNAN